MLLRRETGGASLRLRRLLAGLLLLLRAGPHGDGAGPWVVERRPRRTTLVPILATVLGLASAAGGAARGGRATRSSRRGCRGSTALGGGGDERRGGSRGGSDLAHGQFLKQQIISDFIKGGEGPGTLEEGDHVAVLFVQAAQNVQHQRAIMYDLA